MGEGEWSWEVGALTTEKSPHMPSRAAVATTHSDLVSRLLMFGVDRGTGCDIHLGMVKGVRSTSGGNRGDPVVEMVPVGFDNIRISDLIIERL